MRPSLQHVRARARALLGSALVATACAEPLAGAPLGDETQLYFPLAVEPAAPTRYAWVASTDFDRRFGCGWLALFDAVAWADAADAAAARAALRRGPKLPGLAARMVAGGGRWFVSHRGLGTVTVLDALPGDVPALSCGARSEDDAALPVALSRSSCDRAHLLDLPQAFVDGEVFLSPRSLLDAAALAYLPAASGEPAWPRDRLLVGSLESRGRARLVALELTGEAEPVQVLMPPLDLRMSVGGLLVVPPSPLASAGPRPLPEVLATSLEPTLPFRDPSLAALAGGPVPPDDGRDRSADAGRAPTAGGQDAAALARTPAGAVTRLAVATSWGDTEVDATTRVALASPLGGQEMVALALDPTDPDHLLGLSRGPDALFDLRRVPAPPTSAGPTTQWVQGTLERPLPHTQPQALQVVAVPAGVFAVVAAAGDDSLTFVRVDTGDIAARVSLRDLAAAADGAVPADIAHLRLGAARAARGRTVTDLLLVTLFFRHALAVVDVSGPPDQFALVEVVAGADLPVARRFLQ